MAYMLAVLIVLMLCVFYALVLFVDTARMVRENLGGDIEFIYVATMMASPRSCYQIVRAFRNIAQAPEHERARICRELVVEFMAAAEQQYRQAGMPDQKIEAAIRQLRAKLVERSGC